MILPPTLATPFQQFYANSHSSNIHNYYPPNDLEASYDAGDAAVDSSTSTPVSIADNSLTESGLHGSFLIPSPPSWQGIDNNIAPQFTCNNSDPYCCTGRYIRRKGWVLGPCYSCSYHFPLQPARQPILTCVIQIVRERTNVNKYLISTAAATFLRFDMLSSPPVSACWLLGRIAGEQKPANISFYLGIGWCNGMRSSQSRSIIQYPFFSEKLLNGKNIRKE